MPRIERKVRKHRLATALLAVLVLGIAGGWTAADPGLAKSSALESSGWRQMPVEVISNGDGPQATSAELLYGPEGEGAILRLRVRNDGPVVLPGAKVTLTQQRSPGNVAAVSRRLVRTPLPAGEELALTLTYEDGFLEPTGTLDVRVDPLPDPQPGVNAKGGTTFDRGGIDDCISAAERTCGKGNVKSVKVTGDSCEFTCK